MNEPGKNSLPPANDTTEHIGDVYRTLRTLAQRYLHSEGDYHTLQPTALVHEAYLRMLKIEHVDYSSKAHFFATAARQMRRILVEHARAAKRQKRGGGSKRVTLNESAALTESRTIEILVLEQALERLASKHPRPCRVAELRIFAGLDVCETALVIGVSERTVKGDWRLARAWLARELTDSSETAP